MAAPALLTRPFDVASRGTSVRTEVLGGATTFLTMAYILFVNPSVLGSGEAGLPFEQVLTVTALAAGVMTIAMGLVSGYPFALAPGLGLNAVVAFQLVGNEGLSYPEAMGVVVTEGLILAVLVLTGFREAVLDAIPLELKSAIAAGIGLFIAVIGFANGGLVVPGDGSLLALGDMSDPRTGLFVVGLLLTAVLVARRTTAGLLLGIVATTVLAVLVNALAGGDLFSADGPGVARLPERVVSLPDLSLVGAFSFDYVGELGLLAAGLAVFALLLTDFFDTLGTVIGLGREGNFLDADERLPRAQRVLLVDSLAAAAGGAVSASSTTTYVESASGIDSGARTGLANLVTGGLFLAALFFAPLAGVVPAQATAPVLVLVGFLLLRVVADLPWRDPVVGIPIFLTVVVMPFTYSITDGIGAGFVSWTVLALAAGRARELHPLVAGTGVVFAVYFALDPLRSLLGV